MLQYKLYKLFCIKCKKKFKVKVYVGELVCPGYCPNCGHKLGIDDVKEIKNDNF